MSDEKTFSPENEEIQGENSDTASADSTVQEAEIPTTMPLLAVRDIVVFNYMILPLFVGREKSVQAVDAALNGSRYIFISTQKDETVDDPGPEDLYRTGTVAMIMRMLKLPDGRIKILVQGLAKALGGEYGASRPVVDAGWVEHNRQVGTTGTTVSPKLYVACGISGAIQHLAGMKKSDFIVAINTDKDAPIGEVANVLVVADLKQFIPVLTEKLSAR